MTHSAQFRQTDRQTNHNLVTLDEPRASEGVGMQLKSRHVPAAGMRPWRAFLLARQQTGRVYRQPPGGYLP